MRWVVGLLSSVRFAMVLILVIALIVLAGTIIDQAPSAVVADHAAYASWLAQAQGKYGSWTNLLDRLQLFNVFRSLFFRALVGVLALSIVVCTTRRWRSTWNTAFHTRTRMTESFLLHARFNAQLESRLSPGDAATRLKTAFGRYRVKTETDGETVAFFAEKNRFSRFGTFATHLGFVLILVGAVAGGLFGFSNPQFVVAEGASQPLGLGTNLSVRLDHTVDDFYPDGRPKDLASDLSILENGKVVKQGTVLVNAPLRYQGIAFHESYYGQAEVMKVEDAQGNVLFDQGVPLSLRSADGQRPVGTFDLPGGMSVYLTGPLMAAEADPFIPAGQVHIDIYQDYVRAIQPQNLSPGQPVQLEGLTFTFEREGRYAGLNVVKDPGTTIIWVAGGLMVAGMVLLFYLPSRRFWGLCRRRPDGTTEILLGMPAQRDIALGGEFKKLSERAQKALGSRLQPPAPDSIQEEQR